MLNVYATLPNELKYEFACAQYIVKMFAKNGDLDRAEEHLKVLSERYGDSEDIKHLRVEIAGIESAKIPFEKPSDIIISDYSIDTLKNVL